MYLIRYFFLDSYEDFANPTNEEAPRFQFVKVMHEDSEFESIEETLQDSRTYFQQFIVAIRIMNANCTSSG